MPWYAGSWGSTVGREERDPARPNRNRIKVPKNSAKYSCRPMRMILVVRMMACMCLEGIFGMLIVFAVVLMVLVMI